MPVCHPMFRIRICECGRPVERDPKTGKAKHGTSNSPMCSRCYRIHKTWKKSQHNPDNLSRDQKGNVDMRVHCKSACAWTAWGNIVP